MSTAAERSAEDAYKAQNDAYSGDVGVGDDPAYRGSGIVSDREAVGGMASMSGDVTNSDAQLQRDGREAINEGETVAGRTRGAGKRKGTYREPDDTEGLPGRGDTGSSSLRTSTSMK